MNWKFASTTLALATALLTGCAQSPLASQADAGWSTLYDANSNLNQWTLVGDANWRIQDGALQADFLRSKTPSYLVTKTTYQNIDIRAEVWVDSQTNSGIFIRCQQADKIGADSCYEINIWDTRPDPSYGNLSPERSTGGETERAGHRPGTRWQTRQGLSGLAIRQWHREVPQSPDPWQLSRAWHCIPFPGGRPSHCLPAPLVGRPRRNLTQPPCA
jgi:hypothetical protein